MHRHFHEPGPGPVSAGAGFSPYQQGTYAPVSGGSYTVIAPAVTGTNYVDSGVTPGVTYYYVVSAVNTAGESPNSNQAGARPK